MIIKNKTLNEEKHCSSISSSGNKESEKEVEVEIEVEGEAGSEAVTTSDASRVDVELDKEEERAMRLEHERLAAKYRAESVLLQEALKRSSDASTIPEEDEDQSPGEDDGPLNEIAAPLSESREQFSIRPKQEAKEEDIRKRQLYLKAQRDKLVALKKQKRSQKLEANTSRPSSARVVAEASIDGKQQDLLAQQQAVDASILQVRKALAARLKAEVVQK